MASIARSRYAAQIHRTFLISPRSCQACIRWFHGWHEGRNPSISTSLHFKARPPASSRPSRARLTFLITTTKHRHSFTSASTHLSQSLPDILPPPASKCDSARQSQSRRRSRRMESLRKKDSSGRRGKFESYSFYCAPVARQRPGRIHLPGLARNAALRG